MRLKSIAPFLAAASFLIAGAATAAPWAGQSEVSRDRSQYACYYECLSACGQDLECRQNCSPSCANGESRSCETATN